MNKYIICMFILIWGSLLYSETRTSGGDFLKIGVGGRNVGMGEATSAMVDDIEALHINIGGLVLLDKPQLFIEHAEWLESVRYEVFSFGFPIRSLSGTVGINLQYLYLEPFASYDSWGIEINKVRYNNFRCRGGYSIGVLKKKFFFINIGSAISLIRKQVDNTTIYQSSIDFGILSIIKHNSSAIKSLTGNFFNFSIVMQNFGLINKGENEELPLLLKTGIGFKLFNRLNTDVDFLKYSDVPFMCNAGVEYWLFKIIAVRAGMKFLGAEQSNRFTMGVGVKTTISGYKVSFDYALAPIFRNIEYSHRFSLKINLRAPDNKKEDEIDIWYYRGIYYFMHKEYKKAIEMWNKVLDKDPDYRKARAKIKVAKLILQKEKEQQKEFKYLEENFKKLQQEGWK